MGVDLFGLDIAGIVADAVASAGGVLDATLTKVTPTTREPGNQAGGTQPTAVAYACKGFIAENSKGHAPGTMTRRAQLEVVLLGATINGGATVPEPGDRVAIEGKTFAIVSIDRDPAAATYTCGVRGS